jgi:DNA-binding NtrC family response regulator
VRYLMTAKAIFLVDGDETICSALGALQSNEGFTVTVAANILEALKPIGSEQYDVLWTGLHMRGAGDGLTVVSAMRQVSPATVTVLLSSPSEMGAAAQAIRSQTEDILVKPMEISP